jgi:hypothetical protein
VMGGSAFDGRWQGAVRDVPQVELEGAYYAQRQETSRPAESHTRNALRDGSMPRGYDNWTVALGTAVVIGLGACSTCCLRSS